MLLQIVYVLMCRVLSLAVLFRGDLAKDAELLVLRHENAVLRRLINEYARAALHSEEPQVTVRILFSSGWPVPGGECAAGLSALSAGLLPVACWCLYEELAEGRSNG